MQPRPVARTANTLLTCPRTTSLLSTTDCSLPRYLRQRSFSLDIDALQPEMNSVDLTAEVAQITDINTFDRDDGSTGKVCNLILEDDTGRCVLTLWDDATALTAELEDGDTVRIENGYSTEASDYCQSRFDCDVEVRLGDDGTLLRKNGDEGWTTLAE